MKNTDKVTLTVGQIKKLVKEARNNPTSAIQSIADSCVKEIVNSQLLNEIVWDIDKGHYTKDIFEDERFLKTFGSKLSSAISSEYQYVFGEEI